MLRGASARAATTVAVLAVGLATTAPCRLAAQHTLSIPVGVRIRVTSAPYTGAGYAAWATQDTLTMIVSREAEPIRLPLASVTSLEARIKNSPRRSALRRGALGFLAGTAVWGLSHAFVNYEAVYPYQKGYTSLTRAGAFALYAGTGATVGTLWGALYPGSRWERARPPVRVLVFEP